MEEREQELVAWELHYAALCGDIDAVRRLIAAGWSLASFDDCGMTPLHHAAREEQVEIVSLLLQAGAPVDAHDESKIGNTALSEVGGSCSVEMARVLLNAGANPTIRGWMQLNALDRAKDRKDAAGMMVYQLLLKAAEKTHS